MQTKQRLDLYRELLEFISRDIQTERRRTNRRMLSVLLWCLIMPAGSSLLLVLLIRFGAVPKSWSHVQEWLALIFPITFTLYVLSVEVLAEMPSVFRRGGVATSLNQAVVQGNWRARVCEELRKGIPAQADDWQWLAASMRLDIAAMRHRNRYMTALAGAVFFLILQGIDSLGAPEAHSVWATGNSIQSWFEISSNNISMFVALGLFLVLFYISGNETCHSLSRYQDCAELIVLEE